MNIPVSGPVLLLGAGKMGGALLTGLLGRGLKPADFRVADPSPPPEVKALLDEHHIAVADNAGAFRQEASPSVILAAVKPQVMDDIFPEAARLAAANTMTISIAAGKTISGFAEQLPAGSAVVRAMPNTPAAIGHGMTVCCANAQTSDGQRDLATELLSAVGDVAWVADEALMDAVTAVSGSGPAYVFHLVECMAAGGVAAGLPEDLAMRLARQTVIGSGALLAQSELSAGSLRKNVTSPGGTTAAALDVLMGDEAMQDLFRQAIRAAEARGRELAKGS